LFFCFESLSITYQFSIRLFQFTIVSSCLLFKISKYNFHQWEFLRQYLECLFFCRTWYSTKYLSAKIYRNELFCLFLTTKMSNKMTLFMIVEYIYIFGRIILTWIISVMMTHTSWSWMDYSSNIRTNQSNLKMWLIQKHSLITIS